ncbi:hypothetical protein OH76DRAFT_474019 [Lentinus brumalis]|uniref:Uncharacterized protein n=1 Tax=Lentinus brumalis TaxID=2498619 RepID=A0A371DCU9_9APHY|nr:hypothetical protein OH76DRAFT_474019 [Polyporus brumalis]
MLDCLIVLYFLPRRTCSLGVSFRAWSRHLTPASEPFGPPHTRKPSPALSAPRSPRLLSTYQTTVSCCYCINISHHPIESSNRLVITICTALFDCHTD